MILQVLFLNPVTVQSIVCMQVCNFLYFVPLTYLLSLITHSDSGVSNVLEGLNTEFLGSV